MTFSREIFLSKIHSQNMAKTIPKTQKRKLLPFIRNNFGKLSQREIARQLGIGKTSINRWAAELGFKHKKHTVNESFFDKLNESSAYLLGLIYADGNIAWNPNPKKSYWALTITASAKDKEHLENIRTILKSTKPLLYSEKTNSYRLIANSKKLCSKLMELGVTPNKSLTIEFPEFLPEEHLNHFVRGIIDGDGNIRYVDRERSPYFEITIASGSKKFCEGLVNAIQKSTGIKANIRLAKQNTYVIQYSCSRGEKLAKYIYSNANLYLKRKKEAYKICLEVKNK